jgi:hypothetical protein
MLGRDKPAALQYVMRKRTAAYLFSALHFESASFFMIALSFFTRRRHP